VVEVTTRELTRVPGACSRLLGLANLRGEILPVFELLQVLGRTPNPALAAGHLVVLGSAGPEVGFLASALDGVVSLSESQLSARDGYAGQTPFVRGLTADARLVLDGQALLEAPAFFVEGAARHAPEPKVSP
jgi:purine-binding chemotaxis protein CheW